MTSGGPQSENHRRPWCQRGCSPNAIPSISTRGSGIAGSLSEATPGGDVGTRRYSTRYRTAPSSTLGREPRSQNPMNRYLAASPVAETGEEHRSVRKHKAILTAARTVFLRNGYLGTSVDEIAALAAVSKQTVYKHFADKERLFTEIVISTVNEASDQVADEVFGVQDSGDVEADLRDLARRQLALVIQPRILQLRRLVIGEVARFPELGRTFYDQGPGRTIAALAATFERPARALVVEC